MRVTALLLIGIIAFGSVGCAKKSASEQLQEDMKKAASKMDKDLKSTFGK